MDVIAAVDAGIIQSLNIRSKAQLKRAAGKEARAKRDMSNNTTRFNRDK